MGGGGYTYGCIGWTGETGAAMDGRMDGWMDVCVQVRSTDLMDVVDLSNHKHTPNQSPSPTQSISNTLVLSHSPISYSVSQKSARPLP